VNIATERKHVPCYALRSKNQDARMEYLITDTQRQWQMKARQFAEAEIRPLSLARDQIAEPAATFDWNIIRKGTALGIRTAAVPVEYGGHGIDFTTQALMIAEMAKADSAIAKTFSQSWKWSHLIDDFGNAGQKQRFFSAFVADDTFVLGGGITEPNAGSDNRLPPPDDPKSGLQLRAQLYGDTWVLNGSKCYIANANIGKLIFSLYAHRAQRTGAGRHDDIRGAARHAGVESGQGVQQTRLALLPECRIIFRKRARSRQQPAGPAEWRTQETWREKQPVWRP
jgi:alkylation response protein AidB-like acyl-CoA dehydrogenase